MYSLYATTVALRVCNSAYYTGEIFELRSPCFFRLNKEGFMEIKLIGSLIVIIGLCIGCSGCSWTGTKSVDVWGLKWENYAGMDARVGFNNVDEVEDKRGIKAPSRSERY